MASLGWSALATIIIIASVGLLGLAAGLVTAFLLGRANVVLDGEHLRVTIVGGNECVPYAEITDVSLNGGYLRVELASGRRVVILPYFENMPEIATTLTMYLRRRRHAHD